MTSGILAAVVIMFIGAGVIGLSLARIAAIADRDLPHPPEPGTVRAAVEELGAEADALWREPETVVPRPDRKPGGGLVI